MHTVRLECWRDSSNLTSNSHFNTGTMSFYAWHRKFLVEFENILRSMDPKFKCVTVPYWDWAQEYKVCAAINGGSENGAAEDDSLVRGHEDLSSCNSYMDVSHILKDFGGPGDESVIKGSECCTSTSECDCSEEWCDESKIEAGMFRSFCDAKTSHWRDPTRRWGNKPDGCSRNFGADDQCIIETAPLGKPTGQGCVTQGPFKDWVDFEGRKCLVRGNDWDPTGRGAMTGMSILCFSDIQSLNHLIKIRYPGHCSNPSSSHKFR